MRILVCLSLLGLLACGGDDGARWQGLARGPAATLGHDPASFGGAPVEVSGGEGVWRTAVELQGTSLEHLGDGLYRTGRPMALEGGALRLTVDGKVIPILDSPVDDKRQDPELAAIDLSRGIRSWLKRRKRPGGLVAGPFVYLALEPEAKTPDVLRVEAELPAPVPGRVELRGLAADGFLVPAGGHVLRETSVPDGSAMRFEWSATGWLEGGRTELVLADGDQELGRWARDLDGTDATHAVAIPIASGDHAFRFRIEGDAARVAVLLPRIGPAELGRPDARPWPEARRDVVLLLADTYRADNLAAWGGDPRIAPKLNGLADESKRFLQVRAPATWTLPSHAAFLCGMYPPQCGVNREEDRLPESAWTLAEHFAAAGYRTAAVTDRGFVSRAFGMDQGFEWFDEGQVDDGRTVSAIEQILAADDGRPLFLFVQSYRAHDPYRTRPYTAQRLGEDFRPRWTIKETLPYLTGYLRTGERGAPFPSEVAERAADYERHYRGSSADLDLLFGVLLERFDVAGLRGNTVLCLTSDHGESFGRRGVLGHGSGTWDGQAHVPLTLRAPGLSPGDEQRSASLVDLPRTLASLAGLVPHPEWLGQDLLDPVDDPPVFSFQSRTVLGATDVAVVYDNRKLILDEDGGDAIRHGYALDADPSELVDRGGEAAFIELREDIDGILRVVRTPLLGREDAVISADQRANLNALGYGGDE